MLLAGTAPTPLPLSLGFGIFGNPNDRPASDLNNGAQTAAGLTLASDQGAPDAAPDVTPAAPGAPTTAGDLSFALKLDAQANSDGHDGDQGNGQAGQSQAPEAPTPAVQSAVTAIPAAKETRHADQEEDAGSPTASKDQVLARTLAYEAPGKSVTAEPAAPQPHTQTAKALESSAVQTPALEPAAKPATAVRELSIQVGQTQQGRVELRMVERSGELQVAVRATNPEVAQGLRQGLPDLVERLEQNGFRAEAWRPGTTPTAVQGTGETRQRPMQFQNDPSQSQSGGQQGRQQQNRQNQSYRPQWVQELEGNLSGGRFSGELNGVTS